jgi:CubicO group peptidase (beta-lactamase class C family)
MPPRPPSPLLSDALKKTPGIQYIAVSGTETLLEFTGGLADLHRQSPVTPATTMMAYSMSKTITAVAVLQLIEAGRVGLDDPVNRYVDALPYGAGMTIRHLLSHTSGIPNPIPLRWVHPSSAHAAFHEDGALTAVLRSNPRLASAPGSRYRYSNIGYWLLGKVVERVAAERFTSYVDSHIIRPLGLSPSDLGYTVADPSSHATGYLEKYSFFNLMKGFLIDRELIGRYSGRWLEIRTHYLNGPAFGGLVGTARAFARFLQDQLRDDSVLVGGKALGLLYSTEATSNGLPIAMTLGWHTGELNGTAYYFKEGGGGGFHSMMRLYPDRRVGTVGIANATSFNIRRLLDEVDRTL